MGFGLLYLSIYQEQILIDPATGFFNAGYTNLLVRFSEKNNLSVGSLMRFGFSDAAALEGFATKLLKLLPEDVYVIRSLPDEVVVLTLVSEKSLVHMITEDVKAVAEEGGMEVSTSYELRKSDESNGEFLWKYLH